MYWLRYGTVTTVTRVYVLTPYAGVVEKQPGTGGDGGDTHCFRGGQRHAQGIKVGCGGSQCDALNDDITSETGLSLFDA